MVTLGSGSMLALEGGMVRFVRRYSGGVPRSAAGGGGAVVGCIAECGDADAGGACEGYV